MLNNVPTVSFLTYMANPSFPLFELKMQLVISQYLIWFSLSLDTIHRAPPYSFALFLINEHLWIITFNLFEMYKTPPLSLTSLFSK